MDGESSRAPTSHSKDRLPPPHESSFRAMTSARDEALWLRLYPQTEQRYSRSETDRSSPAQARAESGRTDHEHMLSSNSYNMRGDPMPPSRPNPSFPRVGDHRVAHSALLPPSDLSRPPHSTPRPDERYGLPPSSIPAARDGGGGSSSSTAPRHFHRGPSRRADGVALADFRDVSMPGSRDPYRSPKRLAVDPKMRLDGYADPPYYHSRRTTDHAIDPHLEYGISRLRSSGEMQPAYPLASPPRRVSNASPPPYPVELADASMHRDKRARLDLYAERPQVGPESALRPSSSSHRSVISNPTSWLDRSDLRDRRARDGVEAPYRVDGGSKGARSIEWANPERAELSRRTSAISHQTLDAVTTPGSEAHSVNSQSSKVKRRKRAVLSCTECKQRKIKCDRNVPNCGSCVRRGVAHLCRWGDERDYLPAAPASNITPSNAALMARIAQLESQVRVLQSSPNSPAAAHGDATSERSSIQRGVSKYGLSESSSGRSSRFSGQSAIQRPPDFTSRDRNAPTRADGVDGFTAYEGQKGGKQEEEESEHSDESDESAESAESGAEDAGDLLRALATGTSLKNNDRYVAPRSGPRSVPDAQTDGVQDGRDTRETIVKREPQQGRRLNNVRDGRGTSSRLQRGSLTSPEDLASAAMFNIFTADTSYDRTETLRSGLLEALDLLPPRHKTEALIEHYLREAEAVVGSFHRPSLLKELSAFWVALDHMRDATAPASRPLPDLQFGALLLAICEAACEFMTPAEVLDSEICDSRNSINDRLALLARSCLALLGMGQFVRRPNIWGMQAIIVLRHYCFNRDHREEYIVLFTMAIKAAEFMGLHRLGSALADEDRWEDEKHDRARVHANDDGKGTGVSSMHRWKMLTSTQINDGHETETDGEDLDPDRNERKDMHAMWLPRGSRRKNWDLAAAKRYKEGSRVSREHGRKVWFALATVDWLCGSHFDRCYYCRDEMFTTQSPQNIDDSDLTDNERTISGADNDHTGGRSHRVNNAFLDKIRMTSEPTTNSYIPINIEICHTVRSISDALNQGEESSDAVLAIEARFREILRSLPRFYKLDGESEYDPEIRRLHQERPYLSAQRAIIHENVHHRLLKLHRLYMSRGYWNAKYIHSTRTCIESARVVIGVLRALDNAGCRGQRYWIYKFHIFHAVLALQVDLLYMARRPVNREIVTKRADVVAGLKMLHARTDVEGRNPILASSLKVIKVLREEEQARRNKTRASAEASAGSDPASVSSPASSAGSQKKSKAREWTGASESTGDLADHLERRVRETWHTFEPGVDAGLPIAGAETASNLAEDARSLISEHPPRANAATPATEDGSSLRPADAAAPQSAILDKGSAEHQETRDTELDDYLELLSSYQNPDDAPDGGHFFDVLDDMVFEIGSANKPEFGRMAQGPPLTSGMTRLPLLMGADDLAAAGAGFDAFAAA